MSGIRHHPGPARLPAADARPRQRPAPTAVHHPHPAPTAAHRPHPAPTAVHHLCPECKVAATVLFVLVVALTPPQAFAAFAGYATLLLAVGGLARVPPLSVARRVAWEVPFVVFALALPFVAAGERTTVLGVSVSVAGLYGAWNVLAKATLGVVCSALLAATTSPRDLLVGVQRLRAPRQLVQIASFMIRYMEVVAGEVRRMRIARESRGLVGRDARQIPVIARSVGALFVRCYERGERVHLAMLSRGYDGRGAFTDGTAAPATHWAAALCLPAAALTTLLTVLGLSW